MRWGSLLVLLVGCAGPKPTRPPAEVEVEVTPVASHSAPAPDAMPTAAERAEICETPGESEVPEHTTDELCAAYDEALSDEESAPGKDSWAKRALDCYMGGHPAGVAQGLWQLRGKLSEGESSREEALDSIRGYIGPMCASD